jgi:hypothetical protein
MKQKNPNNLQVKPQTIKCIIGEGDKKKNHAQDRKQGNPVKLRFFRPPKFKDDTNNQESDLETNPRIVDRNWGYLH